LKISKNSGELVILFVIMGLACMAMAILQPVMPLYLTSIGVSTSLIGLMLAVGMVGMVFGESSGGWLADKVGLKIPGGGHVCAPLVFALIPIRQRLFALLFWGSSGRQSSALPDTSAIRHPRGKNHLIAVYMTTQSVSRASARWQRHIADNLGYQWDFTSRRYFHPAGLLLIFGLRKVRWWNPAVQSALSDNTEIPQPVKQPVNYRFHRAVCYRDFHPLGPCINSFLPLLATE
jgi:MFS family permease